MALGAQGERRDARGLIPPDGGIDFRVRASVNIQSDLPREPSLAMIPAWRPSLVSSPLCMTKEGLHVILQTLTFTA